MPGKAPWPLSGPFEQRSRPVTDGHARYVTTSDEAPAIGDEPGDRPARRRRWPLVLAVALGVLAALAAFVWWVALPQYRPELRAGERYGIDVSSHQGQVDWQRVADDDIDFAYLKATEGGDFNDDRFEENWANAGAAGLDRGAYHFFTLCTPGDEQAARFLARSPDDAELPPAVDLELAGNCRDRPSNRIVHAELSRFLESVESGSGQRVVLYVGDDFEGRYPVRDEFDRYLWHLRVLRRPDFEGWLIWQVMGFAKVDGIDGRVDLDIIRN